MRLYTFFLLAALCFIQTTEAQNTSKLTLSKDFIEQQLQEASHQIKYLASVTPEDKFPKTFENGEQKFSNSDWWCSGFYPGTLLYLYEGLGDTEFLDLAKQKLTHLEKEQYNKGTHDLGFMLYCSFGNALRLTGDSAAYKNILLTGANSVASRYHEKQKAINACDWASWHYAVIIDNMMNLEFLTQVSKISGDPRYRDIAMTHANTTIKNH